MLWTSMFKKKKERKKENKLTGWIWSSAACRHGNKKKKLNSSFSREHEHQGGQHETIWAEWQKLKNKKLLWFVISSNHKLEVIKTETRLVTI